MVIGITGGIGSGKSTVIDYIKDNINCEVLLTDDIAKELMKPNGISYNKIVSYFGNKILKEDATIDNKKLSNIVFNNKKELEVLNSFTHPEVINYVDDFIQEHKNSLIIIESALLLETSLRDICEEIWYIKVSEDERIQRLIMGKNYTYAQAKLFIDNQKNENYFLSNCHVIINNDNLLIMKKSVDEKLKRINIEQKKRFKALFLLTCFLIN